MHAHIAQSVCTSTFVQTENTKGDQLLNWDNYNATHDVLGA